MREPVRQAGSRPPRQASGDDQVSDDRAGCAQQPDQEGDRAGAELDSGRAQRIRGLLGMARLDPAVRHLAAPIATS